MKDFKLACSQNLQLGDPNNVQIVLEDSHDLANQIGMLIIATDDFIIGCQDNGYSKEKIREELAQYKSIDPVFQMKLEVIIETLYNY